jgi:hypothetical protein
MTTPTGETGTVKVEGLNNLVRTLTRAGVDLGDLKAANQKAGNIVAARARGDAPRKSGALAGNVRSARQARRARIMAGSSRVPYAGPIHWGWPARHISSQPFIAEAAQRSESEWADAYRADVVAALSHVRGV